MARSWARKIFSKFKYSKNQTEKLSRPPILERQTIASQRQFTLTPSSSSANLADSPATINSPFFRLPHEIQLQILNAAFGDRIIHLEVFEDEAHRLVGYVCPRSDTSRHPRFAEDIIEDKCFWNRRKDTNSYSPEKDPRNAVVGVLGWLMSCKMAYAIGIDVLYTSNTFCLEGRDMILHFNNCILPQRSSSMTKVEMVWKLSGLITDDNGLLDLKAHLEIPPQMFPNVQDLYISFNCSVFQPIDGDELTLDTAPLIEEQFLSHIDGMVRDLPSTVKEVNVAIPSNLSAVMTGTANKAGGTIDQSLPQDGIRVWRPLPPAQWNKGTSAPGYWLHTSGYQYPFISKCQFPLM